MEVNSLPKYDMSDNPTNCCPRFNSEGWDEQDLHFKKSYLSKLRPEVFFTFLSIWVQSSQKYLVP